VHHQLPEGQQVDNLNGGPSSLALEEQGTSPSVPAIRDPRAPSKIAHDCAQEWAAWPESEYRMDDRLCPNGTIR